VEEPRHTTSALSVEGRRVESEQFSDIPVIDTKETLATSGRMMKCRYVQIAPEPSQPS